MEAADNDSDCFQISDEEEVDDEILLEKSPKSNRNDVNSKNDQVFIRGPYERAWTTEATRALIHIRGPMEDKFNEGRQQRTTLWLLVTKQLHKLGYRYSPAKVQKKWHNILITYNKNISKKEESGYVHWEFFEEMYKYLEGKRGTYDRKNISNENRGCEESYQFQQNMLESDGPLENLNDYNPGESNYHHNSDERSSSCDEPNVAKKFKFNYKNEDSSSNNIGKLPLEISHVRGGQEMPKEEYKNGFFKENSASYDNKWWHDYLERKLQCENSKLQLQKEMHIDVMNFNKMSLIQQEKIERIKIDAINNLTTTLQKLVEVKNESKSDKFKEKKSI